MIEYKIEVDDFFNGSDEHTIIILNENDKLKWKKNKIGNIDFTDFDYRSRDVFDRVDFIVYIDHNYQYKVLKDRGGVESEIYYEVLQNEIRHKKLNLLLQ